MRTSYFNRWRQYQLKINVILPVYKQNKTILNIKYYYLKTTYKTRGVWFSYYMSTIILMQEFIEIFGKEYI